MNGIITALKNVGWDGVLVDGDNNILHCSNSSFEHFDFTFLPDYVTTEYREKLMTTVSTINCNLKMITIETSLTKAKETIRKQIESPIWIKIMEIIPAAALLIDMDGNVIYYSKTMRECYGSTEERNEWANVYLLAETTQRAYLACSQFYNTSSYPLIRALKGEVVSAEESKILRADKTIGTVCISASPLMHFDKCIIAFIVDNSKRVAIEEEYSRIKVIADAAEQIQARSKFVATASHEIRTPVNGILGMCDLLLLDSSLTTQQKSYVDDINKCTEHLLSIINMFLDFRRMEDKSLILENSNFDIALIVDALLVPYYKMATRNHNKLVLHMADNLPKNVCGDSLRVTQIINNFLDNAFKFVEKNGSIEVSVANILHLAQNMVQIKVFNDGPALSPEIASKIFQPFVQADNSTTRKFGGSGLGLCICRDLASLMHGRVYTEPVDVGVVFVFEFPYEIVSPKIDCKTPIDSVDFSTCRLKHVLLAEDEKINQLVVSRLITRKGIKCSLASNGQDAYDIFKRDVSIEIVLMDCMMPQMDGLEATRKIRNYEKTNKLQRKPIAALTANTTVNDRVTCMKVGMDAFITKPCTADKLYYHLMQLEMIKDFKDL